MKIMALHNKGMNSTVQPSASNHIRKNGHRRGKQNSFAVHMMLPQGALEHRFTNPKNPVSVTGKTEVSLTQQEKTGFFSHNYEY
jgi:hypothetical protein